MSFLGKVAFFGKWLATPLASVQSTAHQARESMGRISGLVDELRKRNAAAPAVDNGQPAQGDFNSYVERYGLTADELDAIERKYRIAWRVYQFAGVTALLSALLMLVRGEFISACGMLGFSVIASSIALKMRHKHIQTEERKLISFAAFCKGGGVKRALFE